MNQIKRKKKEDIQDPDHALGGGELPHLLDTGDQEAGQEDVPIQSPGAGGDLKVQGGEGLIHEREVEGQEAHQKTETKRKKIKKRNVPKPHQKVTAQPDGREVQAERDDDEEAEVEQDLLKNPGLPKGNCPAHHPPGGTKKKRRKTKSEAETRGSGPPARRRGAKTRRRSGSGSRRVTRT